MLLYKYFPFYNGLFTFTQRRYIMVTSIGETHIPLMEAHDNGPESPQRKCYEGVTILNSVYGFTVFMYGFSLIGNGNDQTSLLYLLSIPGLLLSLGLGLNRCLLTSPPDREFMQVHANRKHNCYWANVFLNIISIIPPIMISDN